MYIYIYSYLYPKTLSQTGAMELERKFSTSDIRKITSSIINYPYLLGGWATPLKNDGVRQLGWWEIPFIFLGKCQKWQPNHQPDISINHYKPIQQLFFPMSTSAQPQTSPCPARLLIQPAEENVWVQLKDEHLGVFGQITYICIYIYIHICICIRVGIYIYMYIYIYGRFLN